MFKRAIILLFLLYFFIPSNTFAVKITIPPTQAYNGNTVIVPVNIDHAEALAGFQMTVAYDAAVLQATGAITGDISTNPQWVLVADTITPGQITVAAYDTLLTGPAVLSGSLVKLMFNVIGDQGINSNLNITSIKLSDIYGKGITAEASPGIFHTSIVDNNGDGLPDPPGTVPVDCTDPPNPPLIDSDGDGIDNACDACPDNTDPNCDRDTDGDGMPDSYEIRYGLNRSDPFDANLDNDGDGLTNLKESQLGTYPNNTDSDGDGLPDGKEYCAKADVVDTDGDGKSDVCDTDDDNDGLTDYEESVFNTNSLLWDTDGDGENDLNDAFPQDTTESRDSDAKETRITNDPLGQRNPNISGKVIVWYDDRPDSDLYMYNIVTAGPEIPIDSDLIYEDYYGISGHRVIWHDVRNWDYNTYIYDIVSGNIRPIMYDVGVITEPAISGNFVVGFVASYDYDICIYDILSDTARPTHFNPVSNIDIAVSGDILAWCGDAGLNWSCYIYDMITNTKTLLPVNTYRKPDISGDIIVWQDSRSGSNIYMYKISTQEETQLTTSGSAYDPAISGNRIVWSENRNNMRDIYMYNISTQKETRITTSGTGYLPEIFGNIIVWQDNRNGNWDIYMYAGDGIGDNLDNCPYVYNPAPQADTDGDGIGDACDVCPDDINNSCDTDSDSDGMPDSFELYFGVSDASGDNDNDGFPNLKEYKFGTNPLNPDPDADGDGIPDTVDNCLSVFPVRIGGADYSSLQSAYDTAADGAIIKSQSEILLGDFNLTVNKSVTLESGHNCDYSTNTGTTRLKGAMTISNGRLTISAGVLIVE